MYVIRVYFQNEAKFQTLNVEEFNQILFLRNIVCFYVVLCCQPRL